MTPKPVNQQNPSSSSSSSGFITVFTEINHFNPKPQLQEQAFPTTIEIFLFCDPIIDPNPHHHHDLRSLPIHTNLKPKTTPSSVTPIPIQKSTPKSKISNPRPNQPRSTPSSVTSRSTQIQNP